MTPNIENTPNIQNVSASPSISTVPKGIVDDQVRILADATGLDAALVEIPKNGVSLQEFQKTYENQSTNHNFKADFQGFALTQVANNGAFVATSQTSQQWEVHVSDDNATRATIEASLQYQSELGSIMQQCYDILLEMMEQSQQTALGYTKLMENENEKLKMYSKTRDTLVAASSDSGLFGTKVTEKSQKMLDHFNAFTIQQAQARVDNQSSGASDEVKRLTGLSKKALDDSVQGTPQMIGDLLAIVQQMFPSNF